MAVTRKQRPGRQLFDNNPQGTSSAKTSSAKTSSAKTSSAKKPRTPGTGYGSAKKARKTLKLLRGKSAAYRRQVIGTMYYRAKYHKYQTQGMREAMSVFKPFL